jgi:replicative DNA helicase
MNSRQGKRQIRNSSMQSTGYDQMIYGKVPPQSVELEEVILGAILIEKSAIEVAMEILPKGSFFKTEYNTIYEVLVDLATENRMIDMMVLVEELKKRDQLEFVGGPYAIVKLTNNVISSAHLVDHCRIVMQKFLAREMIRLSGEFITRAYDASEDVFELMEDYERDVMALGTTHISTPMISIADVMKQAVAKIEYWRTLESSMTGVTSGFKEIDRATRGWQGGDLIIIAARPSVGKTAFALNMARNAAVSGVPVAMFSLEMNAVSQGLRMLSAESDLWMVQIQTGRLDDSEMQRLVEKGVNPLVKLPIYFEEKTNLSIGRFRSTVRRLKKKQKIGLVVVDYLQLMTGEGNGRNREQEISNISRSMKTLAMELDIPIIALSQLSRDVEKRANSAPMLSDLRESGAIEQDADVVAFLWSPSEEDVRRDPSLAKVRHFKIAKQRNGVLIKEDLKFLNNVQRFTDNPEDAPSELPEGNWKKIELPTQEQLPF